VYIDNTHNAAAYTVWSLPTLNNISIQKITFGDGTTQTTAGGGGGSGNVTGPDSSTANAISTYHDATGSQLKNSPVTIDQTTGTITNTVPSQPFTLTAPVTTAPDTPAIGTFTAYSDSANKGWSVKDDAGNITRTVKPTDCSPTGLVQRINADGSVTCAPGGGGASTVTGWYLISGGKYYITPWMAAANIFSTTGFVNVFGTSTPSTVGAATELTSDGSTGHHWYAHPYSFASAKDIIAAIVCNQYGDSDNSGCFVDVGDGTHSMAYGIGVSGPSSNGLPGISVSCYDGSSWTSSQLPASGGGGHYFLSEGIPAWLRIHVDPGTSSNTFYFSMNGGHTWRTFGTVAWTQCSMGTPTQAGPGMANNAGHLMTTDVLSWSVQ
jgi:hypothetical protein